MSPSTTWTARSPSRSRRSLLIQATLLVVGVLALAALWRWRPIREALDPAAIAERVAPYRTWWGAGPVVVLLYVVLEAFCFPLLLLVLITGIAFGPWLGSTYALLGALAAGAGGFFVGRALGREKVERILGSRARRIADKVARNGVLSVFLLRKIPAPYTLMNLIVGATTVSFRDFMLGTVLGLGGFVVVLAVVGNQLVLIREDPSLGTVLISAAVMILPFFIAWIVNRRLRSGGAPP
jgi:phospholipase D1/2